MHIAHLARDDSDWRSAHADGYTIGADESLSDYARACNAHAKAAGLELRLHEVDLDGDAHVFVCLPPAAFEFLVERGYLARVE